MILQALYEYYQRKKDTLPQEGFEIKEIKFVIIINKEGRFIDLVDLKENRKGKQFLLPKSVGRSGTNSWQTAFLLWDHYGFVLAHPKKSSTKSIEMARKQNQTFVDKIKSLPEELKEDKGVNAVLSFYETNQIVEVKKHQNWEDCSRIPGCNLTFRVDGDSELVPQRESVATYQKSLFAEDQNDEDSEKIIAACLITGKRGPIARLHTPTSIIGSKSNARLVSFQVNSGFDSYGKEKAYNAPISMKAEAAYSTALKHLISSSTNKKIISDTTVLFWSEKTSTVINPEEIFSWVIASQSAKEDDPDKGVKVINSLYDAVFTGQLPREKNNHFYVLGLAPNAARISVRFWKTPSVEEFGRNIVKHFDDFKIIHGPNEPEKLSLYQILSSTALQYKMENVPPNLTSKVIESIIDGTPYPQTLIQQCIRRIRAEQNVNRARASIIKASLNRYNRIHKPNEKEITMALDKTNTNPGYLLGRLFAVLERAQNAANNYKEPNAGIRDRFYGAFSSSPISVLPLLEKLYGHHLGKIEKSKGFFESLKGEIMDKLVALNIPAHLSMEQQALFSLGYYHQKQDFFTNKKDSDELEQTTINSNKGE
ncbi:MAG: type I-C CRISPR-associated protein Cas8c/Csd1 [Ignavibacteria bacterium RIFOXYB2_FULL_35_12]|nr:MAG: type I-C CRISPR-associated protein Cas8c/Csd1 [Ignavibacteria bacterium GWA2_36_19]OGU57387.1 MAG: type I-C CRISPR-associated protein Cas8c/Csd1 [Ignavibacteria bacterium GWF2_35_20]OGU88324.1 MAG: type I-C CRISPR-associated protein Cas8c/Csd1 [Ignavibacteria bacterium RIFOXYC12_FULL_35_11]OGU91607.1 MAG: type I-C CRISPR-associated protein Cas8c/Csd1 [Ignavibacteria bacterium RIFOXYA12_FULL_35_25]OGU97851.1 MAG: type I-C CRISPR-associated protein Cas8c/Csd1 [Ignavibacteria bacterium RIF